VKENYLFLIYFYGYLGFALFETGDVYCGIILAFNKLTTRYVL
jgi:hypothetical protein